MIFRFVIDNRRLSSFLILHSNKSRKSKIYFIVHASPQGRLVLCRYVSLTLDSTRRLCVHHGRRVAKKRRESAMGLHNQIRIQNGAGTKWHWRPDQKERRIALQEVRYFRFFEQVYTKHKEHAINA